MYASAQDIIDRYANDGWLVTDQDDEAGIDAKAERALNDAAARIDAKLAARYRLPLTAAELVTAGEALRGLAIDIARYFLASNGTLLTDDIRKRYEDAVKLLDDIAAGKAALPMPPVEAPGGYTSGDAVQMISEPRLFTRRQMWGL